MRLLRLLCALAMLAVPAAAQNLPLLASGAAGPTYFVSNSGSDSNSGLSTSLPWQTVSKVNAATLTPGTTVRFQAGGTWHEQLAIPSSGVAGNLINVDSYGTGTNPIITGADVVGGGGWTQASVTALDTQAFATAGLSGSYWTNHSCTFPSSPVHTGSNYSLQCTGAQYIIAATAPSSNVREIDFWWQLSATTATTGQKAAIAEFDGSAWNAGNSVKFWVSYNGTNYQISAGRGGAIGQTYNVTVGTWYLLRLLVSANGGASTDFANIYVNGTLQSALTGQSLTSAVNSLFVVGMGDSGYNTASFTVNYDALAAYNQDSTVAPNVWTAAVAWQPYAVIFNETQAYATLAPQASALAVSGANQWYWASNVLTAYSVGNPASTYTAPGIQAAHRAYGIVRNNQSYFSLNNLIVEGANISSSNVPGNIFVGQSGPGDTGESSGVQIANVTSRYTSGEGIWLDSANGTISNSTSHDQLGMGFDFDTGANMTGTNLTSYNNLYGTYPGSYLIAEIPNLTLTNFTAYGNTQNGISLSKGSNYVITGATLYNNTYNGIFLDGTAITGATISGLTAYGNGDSGVYIAGGASETNVTVESSLIYGNTGKGIYVAGGAPSVFLYNNVLEGNGKGYWLTGASTAVTAENNITYNNTIEAQIDASVSGALVLNYNDYYHLAGGNFLTWHGTAGTFATWKSSSSQDPNSISADPTFTSVPSNFTLLGGSPAIATGTPLTPNINTFGGTMFSNPPSMGAIGP